MVAFKPWLTETCFIFMEVTWLLQSFICMSFAFAVAFVGTVVAVVVAAAVVFVFIVAVNVAVQCL